MEDLSPLARLLEGKRFSVLSGAGCSTESGIPDYRGPETRRRARNPIQYRQFMQDAAARRRYWARALVGWKRFAGKQPNAGHFALAEMEQQGCLAGIITQNVDRLHHEAGSQHVVELHGALSEVVCLQCRQVRPRHAIQEELEQLNPQWHVRKAPMAPDGDAEIEPPPGFAIPHCDCGGDYKPNVVFFGESVPKDRVTKAWSIVDESEVLVVVGSSLAVYSGYRFVRGAAERKLPVVIINLTETRGDRHAAMHLHARSGEVLPKLARLLGGSNARRRWGD